MKLKAVFNRDGGTFKTTDMDAYCARAQDVFRAAGHDISVSVVAGRDVMARLEQAAREDGLDGLIAGGGDGTISAAAGIAWRAGIPLGVVPAGTMNLFARSLKLPLDIDLVLDTLAASKVEAVDIATVNDRPFVHQFSAAQPCGLGHRTGHRAGQIGHGLLHPHPVDRCIQQHRQRQIGHAGPPVAPQQHRRPEPFDGVHHPGRDEGRRHPAAALDHGGNWVSVQFHPETTCDRMATCWSEIDPMQAARYNFIPGCERMIGNFIVGTGLV